MVDWFIIRLGNPLPNALLVCCCNHIVVVVIPITYTTLTLDGTFMEIVIVVRFAVTVGILIAHPSNLGAIIVILKS